MEFTKLNNELTKKPALKYPFINCSKKRNNEIIAIILDNFLGSKHLL